MGSRSDIGPLPTQVGADFFSLVAYVVLLCELRPVQKWALVKTPDRHMEKSSKLGIAIEDLNE